MIYAYFGDKDQLFEALMERRIAELSKAVRFSAENVSETALARFDYMLARPRFEPAELATALEPAFHAENPRQCNAYGLQS